MAKEVIFNHQLTHQRILIGAVGRSRRLWKHNFQWFPTAQACIYSKIDEVYKKIREKYGEELFMEIAREKRLNERLMQPLDSEIDGKGAKPKCGQFRKKCTDKI